MKSERRDDTQIPFTDSTGDASEEVLHRLASRESISKRYVEKDIIGRGGMGAIVRVWDEDLRRNLAMKVVLDRAGVRSSDTASVDRKQLSRFLEEAQVTAQLDHPGVVPVHELGVDENGAVYFTMQLVRGRNLHDVLELVEKGEEGWTETRALMALLKVCDAMAYAHSKGVIHRDLKPENIMVGRFGEVYVMDWGLARVKGREDLHDVRVKDSQLSMTIVDSDRQGVKRDASSVDSTIFTMDGDVLGTPVYMSPEQARGEIERLGPHTDVYSFGAILYQLLGKQMPYCPEGARVQPLLVLRWLLQGPPTPLHEIAPNVPAELCAICEKAMAREEQDRYADMSALAQDLRAFLEGRVVAAYETGAVAEFRKWVKRNRSLAGAWAAALVILVLGLGTVGWLQSRGKQAEQALRKTAETNELLAKEQEAEARREREKVMRLSAFQILRDLEADAEELWPVTPELAGAYREWLTRADELVAGLESVPGDEIPGYYDVLTELEARAVSGPSESEGNASWEFAVSDDSWWHGQLSKLVREIEEFADPERGLLRGVSPRFGWSVGKRLAFAESVESETRTGPEAFALWDSALASIADEDESPEYDGLELAPQRGLIPLGKDPFTNLWEFAHAATGSVPERDKNGALRLGEDTGTVFVLLPGGTFPMGAQALDSSGFNYEAQAHPSEESPVFEVELDPFFVSKYELTQAQWLRLAGANPSRYQPGDGEFFVTLLHPVEKVDWYTADRALKRFELLLPTEAQWEYAARGGAESPWWTGDEPESLDGVDNLADAFARARSAPWQEIETWLDDGHLIHAPVGSFEANPFGLHDVHGNLHEWCRDRRSSYQFQPREGDGLRNQPGTEVRVARGGAFNVPAVDARSARRHSGNPDLTVMSIGIRAARAVQP